MNGRVSYSRNFQWLGLLAALLIFPIQSQAYGIELVVQALTDSDPNVIKLELGETDGRTSAVLSTGQVFSGIPGNNGNAVTGAGVDILTGEMTLIGSSNKTRTYASASFDDLLSFVLAPGITSATIGFVMDVEGGFLDVPTGFYTGGASVQLGSVSVASPDTTVPIGLLRGAVTITESIDLMLQANVFVNCQGDCFFNLSNTASVALEPLPEGVTFTSQGGFNAVIPVPAAFWLFGSALGLLGWMRRKTA